MTTRVPSFTWVTLRAISRVLASCWSTAVAGLGEASLVGHPDQIGDQDLVLLRPVIQGGEGAARVLQPFPVILVDHAVEAEEGGDGQRRRDESGDAHGKAKHP
ncbi:hypothetical protein JL101_024095 [Skermanella rosea]|uniref:hypothetical protein n=1 Tax=Skermanella rosea TaxID=1817965 RepID=UPI0019324542|nr:hypothetical protein [Skermanella rosea]UEM03019.1 hypothetical protein JL101_024095 [Skermanella rosea]